MALTNFIPQVWSARLLEHLDNTHVFANLVNRDYAGEISEYGDTVKITGIGDVTIGDYTKNADMSAPQELTTEQQLLIINQAKTFNFQVDDIDAAQIRTGVMDAAMRRAAYGLGEAVDKHLSGLMKAGSITAGLGTTAAPIALTAANIYEYVVKMKVALDKANVPTAGRFIVLPPEAVGLILMDDRFSKTGGAMAEDVARNGWVARAAGFDIYESNNVPVASGKYSIIATTNQSTTFAEQIIKTEAYRMEKRFADAVKGLHVYGAKVLRPEAIAVLTATFA